MIGKHCGVRVVHAWETPTMFCKRCPVCKRRFRQKKRVAKKS